MKPFLAKIVRELYQNQPSLEHSVWIFPSKRAGVFAKDYLSKQITKSIFSPACYSIENFVMHLSQVTPATNETALCLLYECYLEIESQEKDSFSNFISWGSVLLQDFNEIDRYAVAADQLYEHIKNHQEVSHWALEENKTPLVKSYLKFWSQLPKLYVLFTAKMLEKGLGHQGLIYRTATEKLDNYLKAYPNKNFCFIGFNALNSSESKIIQRLLTLKKATVYWDIDQYFLENPYHEAGFYIRKHIKEWPYYKEHSIQGVSHHFTEEKKIKLYGAPKNVSQAYLIGQLLQGFTQKELQNTAVVLGDETLLNPVLHALPSHTPANITMGYPLHATPMASLINALFVLQSDYREEGWYIGHVKNILQHPYAGFLIEEKCPKLVSQLLETFNRQNTTYITLEQLETHIPKAAAIIGLLFKNFKDNSLPFLEELLLLLNTLQTWSTQRERPQITSESLYFRDIFEALIVQVNTYPFLNTIKTLNKLYLERLKQQRLSFSGEALGGLQVMGMLESRNLDFETVIISHVNEGILPGGKTNSSYIPLFLKKHFGLPTFKEKDAVYAYHFYRLLQRAKKVYLIYNTATDVLEGGAPSRFIHQIKTQNISKVQVQEQLAMPELAPIAKTPLEIHKDTTVLAALKKKAQHGFSPSALNAYIRNPIDFYKRYVLGLKEPEALEEIIAYNTFGTILHNTLEELYKNCIGVVLKREHFESIIAQVNSTLTKHFERLHHEVANAKGKNLIAFRVLLEYIKHFIDQDKKAAQKQEIVIESLEREYQMELSITGVPFPVLFKGSLDRVDHRNGVVHIVDFKTGNVTAAELKLKDWSLLCQVEKNVKSLQLLSYAMLYLNKHPKAQTKAGIYSFKNTKPGIMFFEDTNASLEKSNITQQTIKHFTDCINPLFQEIFNIDFPFVEKEV